MRTQDPQLNVLLDLENAVADCSQLGLSDREIRRRVRRTLSGRRGFHPLNACWRSSLTGDLDIFWHQNVLCWRIWALPGDAIFWLRGKTSR